ncbi:restriction endonuclease subunit S [Thiomicrorhabdus aquaedulcis]|uniref:restriction endonuclease subunit S n=1 Tax=Thiomicrorhabdus aquaedulcis TaxID=2211106 RepID=UPI000FDA7ABB|nr:restriction endonuclease subunit S [Thiomicrorhabdus aquaedulcis]
MSFNEISLADAVEFVVDNRGKTVPVQESGFPLIATNCVSNENLYPAFNNVRYVSEEIYESWFRSHPLPGDILLTNKGSKNGAICLVPNPVSFCIAQDMVALRAKNGVVYPKYLFAALRSNLVQNRIKELNVDSVIPHFKKTDFNKLFFPLPDYEKQIIIGDGYFNFCNKIELNRQTNQTLEQIAQAIFKSWFVDFDPVKAKIAAKQAGGTAQQIERAAMAAISGKTETELNQLTPEQYANLKTTAALFPDKLVDSELGKIPEGWMVKSLDEIAHYQNGLALQKFRPENEKDAIPVLKIAQLKKGFADGEEQASSKIKAECIVNNGDVVFSWSGSLMVDIWCGGKVALNQHLFKVTSEDYPKWFYYYWTKTHLENFQQIAADKAVTMGHIKREHLTQAKCLIPAFDLKNCEPLQNLILKQIELRMEVFTLQELRDSLLPILLSGKGFDSFPRSRVGMQTCSNTGRHSH